VGRLAFWASHLQGRSSTGTSFAYAVYDFVAINSTPGTHDNVLLHTFTTTIAAAEPAR
jgi:hypothetical protein